METIKSYTDIEQSKKLAEILPLESADMHYWWKNLKLGVGHSKELQEGFESRGIGYTPCWSLAALLDVLPKICYPVKEHPTYLILGKPKDKWCILYWDATGMQDGEQTLGDNPIDACYEMILKLHEQKLL